MITAVRITPADKDAVHRWLETSPSDSSPWLFPSGRKHLSRVRLFQIVRALAADAGIVSAVDKQRAVAYLPRFWWAIMFVITHIPEFVFRRIKL